jgi:hypothetical protein
VVLEQIKMGAGVGEPETLGSRGDGAHCVCFVVG